MSKIIQVTVKHASYNLFEECLSSGLVESLHRLHIFEQFSSLKILHYDNHLHIPKREALMYLNDVGMVERFQDFSLNEDRVDITH